MKMKLLENRKKAASCELFLVSYCHHKIIIWGVNAIKGAKATS